MSKTAVTKFIAAARQVCAEEPDPATRWQKMTPLLQDLLAESSVREQSKYWPDCSQSGERALAVIQRPRLRRMGQQDLQAAFF